MLKDAQQLNLDSLYQQEPIGTWPPGSDRHLGDGDGGGRRRRRRSVRPGAGHPFAPPCRRRG